MAAALAPLKACTSLKLMVAKLQQREGGVGAREILSISRSWVTGSSVRRAFSQAGFKKVFDQIQVRSALPASVASKEHLMPSKNMTLNRAKAPSRTR